MQRQIGRGVANGMLVVLWIVPAKQRKRPHPEISVEVLDLRMGRIFPENDHASLDQVLAESRRLAEEALYHVDVILGEHARDGIVFRREVEQAKIVHVTAAGLGVVARIDIGKLVDQGIADSVYDLFNSTFYSDFSAYNSIGQLDIFKDYYGTSRPKDGDSNGTAEWDIGAYEY